MSTHSLSDPCSKIVTAAACAALFAAAALPEARTQAADNGDLYAEAQPVYVTGNFVNGARIKFFPKGKWQAGLYDSDGDGIRDTVINDLASFANGANNIFNEGIAACVAHPPGDRLVYDNPDVWTDDGGHSTLALRPDVMPEFADATGAPSTNGTQFIQIILPFEADPQSVLDPANPSNNFLSPQITIRDERGGMVACSAFLHGYDAFGNYHGGDPNWPAGAILSWRSLVIIANTPAGSPGIPAVPTAFTASPAAPGKWTGKELRIRVGTLRDRGGWIAAVDAAHLVRRSGVDADDDDTPVEVMDIRADAVIANPYTGGALADHWPGVGAAESVCISPDAVFRIVFNKPVIPVTVGQSIVFNKAPFTGNMKPLPNPESGPNPDPACSPDIEPICPNVALHAVLLDDQGVPSGVSTPVPFRVHPVSQNNLAAYIVRPLIDLPGSSTTWTGDLPGDPPAPPAGAVRMRIDVIVFEYRQNSLTGDPDGPEGAEGPQNLAVAGFHGERLFHAGENISYAFSVLRGPRLVNAPVSPNVLYYAMGRDGIGAIDLNGNGFNTNLPNFERVMWVTAAAYYSKYGNGMLGQGNDYAYPVGLGSTTPIPGINEGSSGWWNDLYPTNDALVRDSGGGARLYPRFVETPLFPGPISPERRLDIADIAVGDFLDTIYYNRASPNNSNANHLDLIYVTAPSEFPNNLISSPPTPNPPPLSIPVGMRPVDVILDDISLARESAYVILGREVFPPDLSSVGAAGLKHWIHLDPAGLSGGADRPFPPNPPGLGPWSAGTFLQDGPIAATSTLGYAYSYASRQQIGNFLFAADRAGGAVHVINSNRMEKLAVIEGFRRPESLAISSDLKRLYVANAAGASVSVVDADPRSDTFLEITAEIPVGERPRGLCCQPDGEDVLVCNFGSDSVSIIDQATNTVRKTLTNMVDRPYDVAAGPRQLSVLGLGWGTDVYHAYISNHGGDNDIIGAVPTDGYEAILKPRGICYDPLYLDDGCGPTELTGGCFVAHTSSKGAAVTRINFVDQHGPWGPRPGGSGYLDREFRITGQWTSQGGGLSDAGEAADVALPDLNRFAWLYQNFAANPWATNFGGVGQNPSPLLPVNNKHPIRLLPGPVATLSPDLLFVSYADRAAVDALDIVGGSTHPIAGLPAPAGTLMSYFKN